MAFNFGTSSSFGAPPTSTFGFGSTNPTTKATTGFGTGSYFGTPAPTTSTFGLGSTATTTTSTGFGTFGSTFGTPATTSSVFGGFGTTGTTTSFSGFGAPAQTTNTGLFSGFGTTSTQPLSSTSLFNVSQPQQSTGFGAFGAKPFGTTTTQSVGFNLGGGLNTGLGQQQQQQQQQQQAPSELEQICHSVYNVYIFGDERDEVLSKFNLLQACWGKGKGFYAPSPAAPVEYTPTNPFHRFKTVGYSVKPTVEVRDGFVILQFNKKEEEIRTQEDQLKGSLTNILGNKPNLILHVDSIKAASESSSLVFLYVEERAQNGQTRRIANTELCSFLLQPTTKSQLVSIGVVDVHTFTMPDKDQIQEYLNNPPAGIDQLVWKQAMADNPDSQKYLPVPLLGFSDLKWRYNCQNEETTKHQAYLDQLTQDIISLRNENENIRLKILDFKQKHIELQHRLLKLMVKQQVYLNVGVALRPEEEILRSQLDNIEVQLNSAQLAGRLSELSTQVRLHKQEESQQDPDSYNMVPVMQQEMKQFLSMQQDAIKSLIEIIQDDMASLKLIETDLSNVKAVKDV